MPKLEAWELVKEFLFPGRSARRAIPPLDGGLTPNDRLDTVPVAVDGITEPEDLLYDESSGALYVSTGREIVRRTGSEFGRQEVVATLPGLAGALAMTAGGDLLVCVAGTGVVRVRPDGSTTTMVEVADDGVAVHCPTDLSVAKDGTVYVTDGSTRHQGADWVRDLMEQNALGRLLRHDPKSGQTRVLANGLAYPSGVTVPLDGDDVRGVLVSEAWAHRIRRYGPDGGAPQAFRDNLPGYPGRLSACPDGYLLAVFALRTQLVEFVLTQRDYVEEMMRTIEPDYWIRPAMRSLNSGLEPLQGGQIRKLGVIKPWAPPRSYGLITLLDPDGHPHSALHSRGGSSRHGVTSAKQYGDDVYIAVHGADQVLRAEAGDLR